MNVLVFKKNSHCDLDLGPRMLILKTAQDTVIINSCVQLNENRSINVRASDENVYFFIFFCLFFFFFFFFLKIVLTLALRSWNSNLSRI